MAGITDLIAAGKELGVFQFYLPFIITFAIVYGLLTKAKIFGEAKNINMIIALASSLFIMAYTPVGPASIALSTFISNLFAGTLLIVLTIIAFLAIMFMLFVPLTGKKEGPQFGKAAEIVVIIAAILGLGVFVSSGGLSVFPGINLGTGVIPSVPIFIGQGISQQDLAIIIIVIITGLAIYWMNKSGGSSHSASAGH